MELPNGCTSKVVDGELIVDIKETSETLLVAIVDAEYDHMGYMSSESLCVNIDDDVVRRYIKGYGVIDLLKHLDDIRAAIIKIDSNCECNTGDHHTVECYTSSVRAKPMNQPLEG